jgi:hypothetical protein
LAALVTGLKPTAVLATIWVPVRGSLVVALELKPTGVSPVAVEFPSSWNVAVNGAASTSAV